MDGRVEKLYGDPTVGPRPKVWTRGQKWKKYSSAKDGTPERLRCGTIQEEMSEILQKNSPSELNPAEAARRILLPFYPIRTKRTREGYDRSREVGTVHNG